MRCEVCVRRVRGECCVYHPDSDSDDLGELTGHGGRDSRVHLGAPDRRQIDEKSLGAAADTDNVVAA